MIDFLRRYQVPVSSGVLLLLGFMLISANARHGRVDPLARVVLTAVSPLQAGIDRLTGGAGDVWQGYINLVGIRGEADSLRERVRTLEGELTRLAEVEAANRRLRELLQFREIVGAPLVAARVIGWGASAWDRTITLDKGSRDGVVGGSAVLVPEGVVGHVVRASASAANVLLISDRNSGVDAVVQRSRVRGILQGRQDGCEVKYVKRGADVQEGDRVVTSGLDGVFPKGVLLGDVVRVRAQKKSLFQTIVVDPRVAFDRLEEVLVRTRVDEGTARPGIASRSAIEPE
jgi:rod shape-determining protein MreC